MLNSSDNMFNNSVLRWLCIILEERFGHHFNLGAEEGKWVLTLPNDPRRITFTADTKTFRRADSDLAHSVWNASAEGWKSVLGTPLPAPGVEYLASPLVTATAEGLHIDYDILGLIYWMLTRQEEVGRTDLDSHGRFPATSSHAYKHGYLERPIVDEWLYILAQAISRNWNGVEVKKPQFNMVVSHDVDHPSLYGFKHWSTIGRMMVGHLVKRQDFKSSFEAPYIKLLTKKRLHNADIYNTFEWLMDQSDAAGIKSAFYFICGRTYPSLDADYELEHAAIRNLIKRIHTRGHEIGLHPSYNTYKGEQLLKKEANRLIRVCQEEGVLQEKWGARMHYLRWQHPTTMRALTDAGINYDTSLGYADRPGFRCGTCYEYPAFDPVDAVPLPLILRPLIAMECTVIGDKYLAYGIGERSLNKMLELKRSCMAVSGNFTLLWHNSYLWNIKLKEMYKSVLNN